MLRRSLWAAPAALALAGTALARPRSHVKAGGAAPSPSPPPPPGSIIVGAWLLISADTILENGEAHPAFGGLISGMLIYDRTGAMSLQIAGERPMVDSVEVYQSLRPSDRMIFLDNYYAYFGTYEVDEVKHVVTHRVRGSLRPNETGITYRRQFGIEGDRLTLVSPPETHDDRVVSSRLIFVRAQATP